MSYKQHEKYINLMINGRLFNSWVLANYKEFQLEDVVIDKSNSINKNTNTELRKYQAFVGKFLDYNSPYKNLLLYHDIGSGKTRTIINVYNILYNNYNGWNCFILLKATLKDNWLNELNMYLQEQDKESRLSNITFISYDSPFADRSFLEAVRQSDVSKKNLFIIEEAHNFISNVYGNVTQKKGKRGQVIYDHIVQDKLENFDTRVILLTGTPAINVPFELALLFNLLRPNSFPKSESQFNQEFVSKSSYRTINPLKKNLFQRRILGLVSYYAGATPDNFATKYIDYVYVKMSEYQEYIYNYFENIENELKLKRKQNKSTSMSKFRDLSKTRQGCNFVFPNINNIINGESRPRPSSFKLSEKLSSLLENGKIESEMTENNDLMDYFTILNKFIEAFDNYIGKFKEFDIKHNHSILDDIKAFKEKYNGNYEEFEKSTTKSKVYEELYKCSPKMIRSIFTIFLSTGPVLVYSNFVLMEGIQIYKIYLKYFGFDSLTINGIENPNGIDYFRYTEYHGMVTREERKENLRIFNQEENKYAKICKIVLISAAGAEGLNLLSIRQTHILEPYWHDVRITQIIGRGMRLGSHRYLLKNEWIVNVYRYKTIKLVGTNWTTDQHIEDVARSKEGLIQSFLDSIKEASVDCGLYKKHNMLTKDYKCFQFEEKSLFADQIGPAYKEDIADDTKYNNGSNSVRAKTIRIKVIKIQAVKQLNQTGDKFSKSVNYWYYQPSGVIYDYDLHYAIGKISTDENNMPRKLNKFTFIIDKLIPIPMIKELK